MKKGKLAILLTVPLLAGTIFILAYSVLHTTAGARWLLSTVAGSIPGKLEMEAIDGDLNSGLTISNLNYRTPDLEVGAQQILVAIDLEFFPLLIRIRQAHIESLLVGQSDGHSEPSPPAEFSLEETLSSLALPVSLELEDLRVEPIRISAPDGSTLFSAERLGAKLGMARSDIGDVLRIDRLFSESDMGRFDLAGELVLATPFQIQTRINSQVGIVLEDSTAPLQLASQLELQGELKNQLQLMLKLENPAIAMNGTLHNLLDDAQWQIKIESPQVEWPPGNTAEPDLSIFGLALDSQGWIDEFQLNARGLLHSTELEDLEFQLLASGDAASLTVKDLALTGDQLDLSASGDLEWQDEKEIRMSATLHRFEPGAWLADWPELHPLQGKINFELREDSLELPGIHLEVANTSISVDGNGRVNLPDGAVSTDLSWKNIEWPVGSREPDFKSIEGEIHLAGALDDWTLDGEADLHPNGLPAGRLQLEARGNRERAAMKIIDGRILGGEISGTAEYDWSGSGLWSADLKSTDIETASILPDWPAKFSADVSAQGSTQPFSLLLDIRQMEGEFKNLPFSASGGMKIHDKEASFDHISLHLQDSVIAINGRPLSSKGLEFSAQIENLAAIVPGSAGSLEASGQLSLQAEKPHLQLDLQGNGLAWQDFSVQSISIHDLADPPNDSMAALQLEMTQLESGTQSMEVISLNLLAGSEKQSLSLSAQGSGMDFSAEVTGGFQQADKSLFEFPWAGQITSLSLNDSEDLTLTLRNPAALEWSTDHAVISDACIGSAALDSACLDGEWQRSKRLSARLRANQVPLSLLQSFLDTNSIFTQTIDGEANWFWTKGKGSSGGAELKISAGQLRAMDEALKPIMTGEGQLSFNLVEGNLSAGKLHLPLPGIGEVNLDLAIPDLSTGLDAGIEGRLQVALADLYIVDLLVPALDQTGGRFSADLNFSGSLRDPIVSGQLDLTDGLIRHQSSGLKLSDIQLSGRVLNNDEASLGGSFRAVEGTGELEASLNLADILSPQLEISIKGENLTLFDSPEISLVAEPDIRLSWQAGAIDIGGKILIPSARIAPRYIPSAVVSESSDLNIVAGQPPENEDLAEPEHDMTINGKLEVALGDDVTLDLSRAVAKLAGSVLFEWQNELMPIATGQYRLVGQINAFGQRLEISEGTIGFPSVPANNPHLNIRAEREIYGNSEIRRAGVFVSGTVNRLSAEPYTQPATNRERARTLLITGSDFNMDQGVGAVDIGTYIAPRVFVSYGFGVFDNDHVVSIRYDLGRGWGVKATSGQRSTGLDLSYTIER